MINHEHPFYLSHPDGKSTISGTIGVRYARGCHPNDLWTKYFTSSKVVQEYREKYGEPDVVEVRQTFIDSLQARKWEEKVLKRLSASKTDKWLNKKNGGSEWCCLYHSDETKLKISQQVKKNRWNEEQRKIHSNLLKGKPQKKKDVEKRSASLRGKKHSPERIQKNKDSHIGIKYPPKTNEYKEKMRDLMIGRVFSPSHLENVIIANRERSKIRCSCIYCQKEIDINNFLIWHGEKCRMKMNIVKVINPECVIASV